MPPIAVVSTDVSTTNFSIQWGSFASYHHPKTDAIQLTMIIISTSWGLSTPISRTPMLHSLLIPQHLKQLFFHCFRNQVSSFVQSLPDNLWEILPLNQLTSLRYFKDLKPDTNILSGLVGYFNPNTMVFRFEDSEVTPTYEEMCAIMGHHLVQDETPACPQAPDMIWPRLRLYARFIFLTE
ncbi:hypothetical protein JCGZ_24163 [Jatropha curcas]|uniref:Uncharacterized protein n=1 Tax=Jatropha curcas TaxID=180498 RepID=A0A067K0B2_JATCU|nr:hypothetical protein JCGZ_24163 [Jatropha curcas]